MCFLQSSCFDQVKPIFFCFLYRSSNTESERQTVTGKARVGTTSNIGKHYGHGFVQCPCGCGTAVKDTSNTQFLSVLLFHSAHFHDTPSTTMLMHMLVVPVQQCFCFQILIKYYWDSFTEKIIFTYN